MDRNQVEEFYRELDATQESYVRRKYAIGGYAGWKSKHARAWIDAKDTARAENHTSRIATWTMATGAATVVLVIITAIGLIRH
jgi:hypothetical protein